jgi:uncharacterized protein YhhL (DUF1145 family)
MYPSTHLKISSVVVTVLWIALTLYLSRSHAPLHVAVLTMRGCMAGYGWHRLMRLLLLRGRIPARRQTLGSAQRGA